MDGVLQEYQGNRYGIYDDYDNGIQDLILADGEYFTGLSGRYNNLIITYLEFHTSQQTVTCDQNSASGVHFILPAGVIYGSSDLFVNSIGTYNFANSSLVIALGLYFLVAIGIGLWMNCCRLKNEDIESKSTISDDGSFENFESKSIISDDGSFEEKTGKKEKNKAKNNGAEEEIVEVE
ncbi:hypothetical protein C1645_855476 [Glomus cerebriforme]|uniref:Jacalin-type lectin domain-containing protein n=1 Tax=Glomus cerebriforme TaxID=658196 RepID=A0A397SME9_9GLOM|nr:hypothetical protein C1645_855476 [Glomus cerebriforme]